MLNINVSDPKSLERAIRPVSKFADTHRQNGMEATQQILVQSTENGLCLTATDLYASVEFAVNSSEVLSDGEFCIKANNLLKLGEIIKDQSAIGLEQTETGVELTLSDAPTFGAKFKTSKTDEFPALPETDPNAHWIELDTKHIAIVKAVMKYAENKKHVRVGFDAVQFARHEDKLFAYATDGKTIAYAELGRTSELPNFAIPVDALKKAFQVANAPDLKTSAWQLTLPTEENNIVTIQIAETAVKFRAGDTNDVMEWITNHQPHVLSDDSLSFNPKALTDSLKKVSKLFIKEARFDNVLIIDCKDGNVTMTAKPVKKYGASTYANDAAAMNTEYLHTFTEAEAVNPSHSDFRIQTDASNFQSLVKDLCVLKPNQISVRLKYSDPDVIAVTGTNLPLGFITMPVKL